MANSILQVRFVVCAHTEKWIGVVEAVIAEPRRCRSSVVYRDKKARPWLEAVAEVEKFLVYYNPESVAVANGQTHKQN